MGNSAAPDGRGVNGLVAPAPVFLEPSVIVGGDHAALLAEVKTLADYIERTRREIAALGADEAVRHHVLTATDELDAIVVHTAEATTTILDICEGLESAVQPGRHDVVGVATARIYEACSFQDIIGQRVAKVVQTLKAMETKIAEILQVFGDREVSAEILPVLQKPHTGLLNGPQQPGAAMDQRAVDALLDADP